MSSTHRRMRPVRAPAYILLLLAVAGSSAQTHTRPQLAGASAAVALQQGATLAGRQLQQAGQQCPGCVPGSCEVSGTAAGSSLVCSQCQGNLLLAAGACSCPAGRYGTVDACEDCSKGSFCPGGPYSGPNTPARIPCGPGMTTLGRRAASIRGCVNSPGYVFVVDAAGNPGAAPCQQDSFSPGLKKQRACVPCPPSYTTNGLTGRSSFGDCVLVDGFFLQGPGTAAACSKGEFRSPTTALCVKCA